MERRIEHDRLRDTRHNRLDRHNAGHMRRIVQRSQIVQLDDLPLHLLVHERGRRERFAAVHDAMAHGVNIGNVREILALASGVVIGTHFKVDGNTWNPVDAERVKRFMDVVETLR